MAALASHVKFANGSVIQVHPVDGFYQCAHSVDIHDLLSANAEIRVERMADCSDISRSRWRLCADGRSGQCEMHCSGSLITIRHCS